MGLFTELALLPLAPLRGTIWVAQRVTEVAEYEMYDPGVIRARLAALNEALENGDIGEAEFEAEEERLLDLLEYRVPHDGAPHDPTVGAEE
ncbi:gas vesicle protein GvpG [Streptomyces sp. JJ36]|uniref:gas vesicle protein GvpG n=1 Tax=Streptomyces sp. JJ36 TaxID=2736645 RepID=UPI001F3E2E31|nr:gas vesicle protein GvpG [Streptomyces sp. JJ36]MCF6525389.1 gas vesicle protein GvpG [Streptomyces sp. JJ36]